MLIIFVVINLMIYFYKGKNKTIMILYAILGISILLRFVETIAVLDGMIDLSRMLSNIFLAVFVLFYIYLLASISRFVEKKVLILMIILFALSLSVLLFSFDIRIIMYILLALNLNIAAIYFIPYRVTTSIFRDIKELVLDYVFIVDDHYKIIYKNNNVSNSNLFNKIDKIDIGEIERLFSNPSIIRKAYDKSFIKILDRELYFQYNKKEIMNEEKITGYIITFTEITDLINMLDNLKLKQEQANNINIKLTLYKEIVYDVEKEREINNLLEEIANNQQQSMKQIKGEIKYLSENINSEFNVNVQKTIEKVKENLLDVRSAVTKYINYYEK